MTINTTISDLLLEATIRLCETRIVQKHATVAQLLERRAEGTALQIPTLIAIPVTPIQTMLPDGQDIKLERREAIPDPNRPTMSAMVMGVIGELKTPFWYSDLKAVMIARWPDREAQIRHQVHVSVKLLKEQRKIFLVQGGMSAQEPTLTQIVTS